MEKLRFSIGALEAGSRRSRPYSAVSCLVSSRPPQDPAGQMDKCTSHPHPHPHTLCFESAEKTLTPLKATAKADGP